jgi:hypothetical protein
MGHSGVSLLSDSGLLRRLKNSWLEAVVDCLAALKIPGIDCWLLLVVVMITHSPGF